LRAWINFSMAEESLGDIVGVIGIFRDARVWKGSIEEVKSIYQGRRTSSAVAPLLECLMLNIHLDLYNTKLVG